MSSTLTLASLFLVSIVSGRDWHIGSKGADTAECGEVANPCPSILAIPDLTENDNILFVDEDSPFEHCMDRPLGVSVTIAGISRNVALQCMSASHRRVLHLIGRIQFGVSDKEVSSTKDSGSGSSDDIENYFSPYEDQEDFEEQEQTIIEDKINLTHVVIRDLIFSAGHIVAINSSLSLINCHFDNGSVAFTEGNFTLNHYLYGNLLEEADSCTAGKLTVLNTTFGMGTIDKPSSLQEAAILEQDVILPCRSLWFTMKDSDVSNRRFILAARDYMKVYVSGTKFYGSGFHETKIGGVTIIAPFYKKEIIIEDCSFKKLYPESQLMRILYEFILWFAPISFISNVDKNLTSYSDFDDSRIIIQNNIFTNNCGAIKYNGMDGDVNLEGNHFEANSGLVHGGSVGILGHNISETEWLTFLISNCTFHGNKVGFVKTEEIIGDAITMPFTYHISGEDNPSLSSYLFDEVRNNIVITTDNHNFTMIIPIDGTGGAIYGKKGHANFLMLITGSQFINNTAKRKGGAIFLHKLDSVDVKKCNFTSTSALQTSNDLFYSDGASSTVLHTSLRIERNVHVEGSTLTTPLHLDGGLWGKAFLVSTDFFCPMQSKISVVNTSTIMTWGDSQGIAYSRLVVKCRPCEQGYTLDAGSLFIEGGGTWDDLSLSEVHQDIQECHPCPPEAVCVNGLASKRDYWGQRSGDQVRFFKCPTAYCCVEDVCDTYTSCKAHRTGTLCGECQDGYSEALFSTSCIRNEDCVGSWVLAVAIGTAVAYALFLAIQGDFKKVFLNTGKELFTNKKGNKVPVKVVKMVKAGDGQPVDVAKIEEEPVQKEPIDPVENSNKDKSTRDKKNADTGESSAFLVIFFYYFQEASLIKVTTPFEEHTDLPLVIRKMKSLFAGIFMFRLELFDLIFADICVFPNLAPTGKIFFKTLFYVLLIGIIVFALILVKAWEHRTRKPKSWMSQRLVSAFLLAAMFSFQKVALQCCQLLRCVALTGENVLFINGEVVCFQPWQLVILFYPICTWIIPFTIVLTLGPGLVASSKVGYKQFMAACFMPLPFLISWFVRFAIRKQTRAVAPGPLDTKVNTLTPEATGVYNVLQGACRLLYLGSWTHPICWTGSYLLRRVVLFIVYMTVTNDFLRVLFLSLLNLAFLICHLVVLPYKGRMANVAATFSAAALMALGLNNLVRATFLVAEFKQTAATKSLMMSVTWIDDVMLVWIPLGGVSIMLVVVILGLTVKLCKNCHTRTVSD